jgi:hypothetical protein
MLNHPGTQQTCYGTTCDSAVEQTFPDRLTLRQEYRERQSSTQTNRSGIGATLKVGQFRSALNQIALCFLNVRTNPSAGEERHGNSAADLINLEEVASRHDARTQR